MKRASSAALFAGMTLTVGCSDQTGGMAIAGLPEPESAAAVLYKQRCGQCHGAPAPSLHTADYWPSVLFRMQNRMAQKGVRPLSEEELRVLTEYLRTFAKSAS